MPRAVHLALFSTNFAQKNDRTQKKNQTAPGAEMCQTDDSSKSPANLSLAWFEAGAASIDSLLVKHDVVSSSLAPGLHLPSGAKPQSASW